MRRLRAGAAALLLALAAAACSEGGTAVAPERTVPERTVPEQTVPGQTVPEQQTAGPDAQEPAAQQPAAPKPDAPSPAPPPPERTTYEIRLTFRPETRALTGVTVVVARNDADAATNELRLSAYLNAFRADRIAERDPVLPEHRKRAYPPDFAEGGLDVRGAAVDGTPVPVEVRGESIVVSLPEPWAPGEWRRLELEWDATLPRVHHRFGMSEDAYWFGNALPTLFVFDGEWRDYAYEAVGDPFYAAVADYRVRITAPDGYAVVATGDEAEPVPADEAGFATTAVEAPRARDFAFALSRSHEAVAAEAESGLRVNVHYRHASKARAEAAAAAAAGMADFLERTVGELGTREADIFENEMFVTGMEYPGFVLVRADRLNAAAGLETVVHEIAHQWFYGAVGNDQVAEPWLDEAFATFLTDAYRLGGKLDATYAERLRAVRADAALGDVRSYDSWSAYWNGNYRLGALMLHALRGELGEDGFARFLRDYYARFRDGVATTEGFVETAEEAYGGSLDAFFARWLP
ncbi:M1 family metallopeptidase [Paenibacillus sp.]|uniref:M1 family metallopeptidase n=1 Tax=Paenibacillus sp. TaxID=58172 RepID=UPI002D45B9BF|nr:M1 family metallopeptidase [Paenibacillus sp.]HZG58224.1 M1 family metallopeptidase [Paenibacillus sp.]